MNTGSLGLACRVMMHLAFQCVLTVPGSFWFSTVGGGCSSGHSFMLQLSVFALGYQGLIFSWVLLVLRLLAGCCYSCRLKTSYLCHVLALLEGME